MHSFILFPAVPCLGLRACRDAIIWNSGLIDISNTGLQNSVPVSWLNAPATFNGTTPMLQQFYAE